MVTRWRRKRTNEAKIRVREIQDGRCHGHDMTSVWRGRPSIICTRSSGAASGGAWRVMVGSGATKGQRAGESKPNAMWPG